ncbi:uncharacterized protein AMSG_02574 [Thecamonas trahens ATCC 50062]|uniref:Uncharacterized protein n=1 Tax=Thecamonas trahens ATCC 50062 TaxID=461836 RepID=A0A0L0D5C3_THETB|nr:hypothetical protein AMSG_02574 [Thecamonas trahens ATCC 50062]KNC47549.1 hypothetical protein AMSG_02574 [Thecamonas trahens ATCC 50062]|eukprot:XP_013759481.1 hypothetical protein AMSG_02574 [Thecamonas trahens ATCC 50062]
MSSSEGLSYSSPAPASTGSAAAAAAVPLTASALLSDSDWDSSSSTGALPNATRANRSKTKIRTRRRRTSSPRKRTPADAAPEQASVAELVARAGLMASADVWRNSGAAEVDAARNELQDRLDRFEVRKGARLLAEVWELALASFAATTRFAPPLLWLERVLLSALGSVAGYSKHNVLAAERHFWLLKTYAATVEALLLLHRLLLAPASVENPPAPTGLAADAEAVARHDLQIGLDALVSVGALPAAVAAVERSRNKGNPNVAYAAARAVCALHALNASLDGTLPPETAATLSLVVADASLSQAIGYFVGSSLQTKPKNWFPPAVLLSSMFMAARSSAAALVQLQTFLYKQTQRRASWKWVYAICDGLAFVALTAPDPAIRTQALQGRHADHLDLLDLIQLQKFLVPSRNKSIRAGVEAAVRRIVSWTADANNEQLAAERRIANELRAELESERAAHRLSQTEANLRVEHATNGLREQVDLLKAQTARAVSERNDALARTDITAATIANLRDANANLKAELAHEQASVASLRSALELAPELRAHNELRSQVYTLKAEVERLRAIEAHAASLNNVHSEATAVVHDRASLAESLNAALAANDKLMASLKASKAKNATVKSAARDQARELQAALSARDDAVAALEAEQAKLNGFRAAAAEESAAASARIDELAAQVASLSEVLAKSRAVAAEVEADAIAARTARDEAVDALAAAQQAVAEQTSAAASATSALASLQSEMMTNVRDNHAALAAAAARHDEVAAAAATATAKLDELRAELAQTSAEKAKLEARMQHIVDDHAVCADKLSAGAEANTQLRAEAASLAAQVESLQVRIAELSDSDVITKLQHKVTAAESKLATEVEHHAAARAARDAALDAGSALNAQLSNESAARARVESQLAAATADADKAHEEIAALKVANRELSDKYHALVNEHKDLHSVHTTKSNSLTAQESATAALKARIVMLEQQLGTAKTDLATLAAKHAQVEQARIALESQVAAKTAAAAAASAEVVRLETALQAAKSAADVARESHEARQAVLEQQLSTAVKALDAANAQLATLESAKLVLGEDVSQKLKSLQDATDEIARLKAALAAAEHRADEAAAAHKSAADKVTLEATKSAELEAAAAGLHSSINALESRCHSAEARAESLDAELRASQDAHTQTVIALEAAQSEAAAAAAAHKALEGRIEQQVASKREQLFEWAATFGPGYAKLFRDKMAEAMADRSGNDDVAMLQALLTISAAMNRALLDELTTLRKVVADADELRVEFAHRLAGAMEDHLAKISEDAVSAAGGGASGSDTLARQISSDVSVNSELASTITLRNLLVNYAHLYEDEFKARMEAIAEGRLLSRTAMVEAEIAAQLESSFLELRSKLSETKSKEKEDKSRKIMASAASIWAGRPVGHASSSDETAQASGEETEA